MRFHLFGLANIPTCKKNTYEPTTPLIWNMAKMLKNNGHHVTFYGVEGSDAPCDEMVVIVPQSLLDSTLENSVPAAAWRNDINSPTWQTFIASGRLALRQRYRAGDISLISYGAWQRFVAEESTLSCEFVCGYSHIFGQHKVFPSRAWMHYLYGELKMERCPNWNDVVIPHYLDLADFQVQEKKDDYLLYLGRLHPAKGVDIAIDIANRSGSKIVVAGVDTITHDVPDWLKKLPGNVEFTGYVNPEKRLELLRGAKALLHPCRYLEPFGMTLIEALACGTPIITSDWGALPEINQRGVTGFCCRDMEEFLDAITSLQWLDPQDCRLTAEHYDLSEVYPQYARYFRRLEKMLGGGWYEMRGTWRGPAVVERISSLQRDGYLQGAEIGVDRGYLSGYLLGELPNLQLIMVDTWEVFPEDSSYTKSGDLVVLRTQKEREADLAETLRVTDHASNRRHIMRMLSDEAAELIPDASLDFVFFDADHSYPGISRDIRRWVCKIRPGGIACGHDYMMAFYPQWGVTRAVDEYAAEVGQIVQRGADWTWFIQL